MIDCDKTKMGYDSESGQVRQRPSGDDPQVCRLPPILGLRYYSAAERQTYPFKGLRSTHVLTYNIGKHNQPTLALVLADASGRLTTEMP